MADGTTVAMLEAADFSDADPDMQPTMGIGPLKVQLDRVIYRGELTVVKHTVVESAEGLSDHSRIRATLAA